MHDVCVDRGNYDQFEETRMQRETSQKSQFEASEKRRKHVQVGELFSIEIVVLRPFSVDSNLLIAFATMPTEQPLSSLESNRWKECKKSASLSH